MFNFNLNPILNYKNFNCILETVKNRFNTYKLSSWQDYKQFSIDLISYPFRPHVEQSKSLSKERIKAIKISNNGKNELSLKPSHNEKKAINNKDTLIENSKKKTDHRLNIKKIALLASGAIAAAGVCIYLYNKIINEFDNSPTNLPEEFKPSMKIVGSAANALITYPKEIFPNYIDFSAPFTKPNLNQYYFYQLNSNIENGSVNSINSNMGIFSLANNVGIPTLAAIVGLNSFWNLLQENSNDTHSETNKPQKLHTPAQSVRGNNNPSINEQTNNTLLTTNKNLSTTLFPKPEITISLAESNNPTSFNGNQPSLSINDLETDNSNSIFNNLVNLNEQTNPSNVGSRLIPSERNSTVQFTPSAFGDRPITESMIEHESSDLANSNSVAESPEIADNENLDAYLASRLKLIRARDISEFDSEIETPGASPFFQD